MIDPWIFRFLFLNIIGLLFTFQAAQERIPHAEDIVPVLWALVGALAILITIMLRLWYRDFSTWKDQVTKSLGEMKGTLASVEQFRKDTVRHLERIQDHIDYPSHRPPTRTKSKEDD